MTIVGATSYFVYDWLLKNFSDFPSFASCGSKYEHYSANWKSCTDYSREVIAGCGALLTGMFGGGGLCLLLKNDR